MGGKTLTLLAAPRIFLILKSLEQGVKTQLELRRDAGSPAQSTLRGHLRVLEAARTIVKRFPDSFPGALEYELTEAGWEVLVVAATLERWLDRAPQGPLELGSDPAKAAIKGLVDSWSATMLAALATSALSLTQLDRLIDVVNYPTIQRRLEAMRLAGQIDSRQGSRGGTAYELTDWMRHGIAPLVAAARWEHRHEQDGAAPIDDLDVECSFLLAAPLVQVGNGLSGVCRVGVDLNGGPARRATGLLEVRDGEVAFSDDDPNSNLDAWVSGPETAWFSAVIDGDPAGLEVGGDHNLARAVLDHLHRTLFAMDHGSRGGSLPVQGW